MCGTGNRRNHYKRNGDVLFILCNIADVGHPTVIQRRFGST